MKKIATLMAAVIALTSVTPAWASVDVYFKFKNSAEFVYKDVDDATTKEQLAQRIDEDFPGSLKNLTEVYVVKTGAASPFDIPGQVTELEPIPPENRKEGFSWGTFIIFSVAMLIGAAALSKSGGSNYKGPCLYSGQRASDGSLCGARAATVRPGGQY